jgi:hypothetical protein
MTPNGLRAVLNAALIGAFILATVIYLATR